MFLGRKDILVRISSSIKDLINATFRDLFTNLQEKEVIAQKELIMNTRRGGCYIDTLK